MLSFLITLQTFIAERRDRLDDEGATMVEYGLMVALVAVVVAGAVGPMGTRIAGLFNGILP